MARPLNAGGTGSLSMSWAIPAIALLEASRCLGYSGCALRLRSSWVKPAWSIMDVGLAGLGHQAR